LIEHDGVTGPTKKFDDMSGYNPLTRQMDRQTPGDSKDHAYA